MSIVIEGGFVLQNGTPIVKVKIDEAEEALAASDLRQLALEMLSMAEAADQYGVLFESLQSKLKLSRDAATRFVAGLAAL